MTVRSLLVALLVGAVQGVLEWIPVSSEGGVTVLLAAGGLAPAHAVQYALFLHAGTAGAAAVYYRDELRAALGAAPGWRPARAFDHDAATLSFLVGATLISGVVGVGAYLLLIDLATRVAGAAFVGLIGALLILTGLVQRRARAGAAGSRERPAALDAVLVGVGQGLAVLPGVSRSGTTASLLLLRGHDGESAFRLSFLLSVPAAVGASALVVLDANGLPATTAAPAAVALATSGAVGYATIDAMMRAVRRFSFWAICVAFGALAAVGGLFLLAVGAG